MTGKILPLFLVILAMTVGWAILGTVTDLRTVTQDIKLKQEVGQLWGQEQRQRVPQVTMVGTNEVEVTLTREGKEVTETRLDTITAKGTIDSSILAVDLTLDHRKKGLLWYSTYGVSFYGRYEIRNKTDWADFIQFDYSFPEADGLYDGFRLTVDGDTVDALDVSNGVVRLRRPLQPGDSATIEVMYNSHGLDRWWYIFGSGVSQVRNFSLTMNTDFRDIDFPSDAISPTSKEPTDKGWELTWEYSNLLSGVQIGVAMPQKVNPGPFVTRVTYFAPVSLFLFFFVVFLVTTIRRINLHAMHYFFMAASFFAFHLLLAYLADHINIHLACAISSVVSIGLVASYMRLVVGAKFALLVTGLAQFVYLILFSYAFFAEGYTGLAVTICCILTLFITMQATAKTDWKALLAAGETPKN